MFFKTNESQRKTSIVRRFKFPVITTCQQTQRQAKAPVPQFISIIIYSIHKSLTLCASSPPVSHSSISTPTPSYTHLLIDCHANSASPRFFPSNPSVLDQPPTLFLTFLSCFLIMSPFFLPSVHVAVSSEDNGVFFL